MNAKELATKYSVSTGDGNIANIPPDVARRAVELLMEWQSADKPDDIWDDILAWREAHGCHELAWLRIEFINQKLGVLTGPARSSIGHATLASAGLSRRQVLKVLSIVVVVGGTGLLASRQQPWREWGADYHTGIGQQKRLTLVDGTVVTLNSNTAINVRYTATERRVVLVKGELYIRTGGKGIAVGSDVGQVHDWSHSPFILEVPQGELQPLGTRFAVRELLGKCRVAVYDGRVQVRPEQYQQSVIIDKGQSLHFTARDWTKAVSVEEAEAAWTEGMIVVSDMRLQDFLAELNRHRAGILQCDPAISNLKVSGTYPLNHADDVLQALVHALPIKLQTITQYWVRVQPDV